MQTIYFEAQTGIIRDKPVFYSNFYQYRLPLTARPILEAAVSKAKLVDARVEYQPGFLESLETMERNHLNRIR
jgi:hypothetical protein